jgi:hypothetical protein
LVWNTTRSSLIFGSACTLPMLHSTNTSTLHAAWRHEPFLTAWRDHNIAVIHMGPVLLEYLRSLAEMTSRSRTILDEAHGGWSTHVRLSSMLRCQADLVCVQTWTTTKVTVSSDTI